MQARAMKHDPQIVYFNAQHFADFFTRKTVNFAQSKSACRPLGQRRKTIVKNSPKIAPLDQLGWRRVPVARCIIGIPVIRPFIRSGKELWMLGTLVFLLTKRSLSRKAPKMVGDFVFQDSDQPGSFGTPTLKFFVGLESRKKRLLHGVLSR